VVKGARQGLWLAFMRVLSARDGAPLGPGQFEFTAVGEGEAAVGAGRWFLPGRDAAFVGGRDEAAAVLSNSGGLVAVFEAAALAGAGAQAPRAAYVAEPREGPALALYPGPPAHIPAAPAPRPAAPAGGEQGGEGAGDGASDSDDEGEGEAALREWEEGEARRLALPRQLMMLTADNR
jgi:hypothetical protein